MRFVHEIYSVFPQYLLELFLYPFYFSVTSVITESDSVNWCRNKHDTLTELLLKKAMNNKQNYRNVKST